MCAVVQLADAHLLTKQASRFMQVQLQRQPEEVSIQNRFRDRLGGQRTERGMARNDQRVSEGEEALHELSECTRNLLSKHDVAVKQAEALDAEVRSLREQNRSLEAQLHASEDARKAAESDAYAARSELQHRFDALHQLQHVQAALEREQASLDEARCALTTVASAYSTAICTLILQ